MQTHLQIYLHHRIIDCVNTQDTKATSTPATLEKGFHADTLQAVIQGLVDRGFRLHHQAGVNFLPVASRWQSGAATLGNASSVEFFGPADFPNQSKWPGLKCNVASYIPVTHSIIFHGPVEGMPGRPHGMETHSTMNITSYLLPALLLREQASEAGQALWQQMLDLAAEKSLSDKPHCVWLVLRNGDIEYVVMPHDTHPNKDTHPGMNSSYFHDTYVDGVSLNNTDGYTQVSMDRPRP